MAAFRGSFSRTALAAALLALATLVSAAPAASAAPGDPAQRSHRGGGHQDPSAPGEFVALRDVAPTVLEEIRYRTRHNFVGDRVHGYRQSMCIVTRDTAEALRTAQRSLLRKGYSLKVYDCYRPQRAVDHFVKWAKDLDDERMKDEFYPRVDKDRLFEDGYIAEKSGHSRGSTVDLTLVRLPAKPTRPYRPGEPLVSCFAPQDVRFPDNSVDMGTGYDCFDTLSHTLDPRIEGKQRANRMLLKNTMEKSGFTNLPEEWWHYTLTEETFPETYFDFPVWRRALEGR
ncbi:D-alanyl-D-alanine dipeptidase [Streptomyces abyssalis]|uniref:D-alanyl-D-alanine dipeptidase n=1 Tax=Streptomyces abyssalis TaxID=933944 RepID=A0A1E7JU00_9ACTN|nr:M15 family metallopeptidase [Streptomyces abyssalis]OEU88918.1 D-alanyl-D-alanine dipeptidase [Streptomyces abyssalis]OEU93425.1 D-alanyl-D-alanine dipeptidase [Streptomyces abyssalis]